ncbi:cation transporter [Metallosphaera hakonensis]|uniref:cation transporter n=1 Tax=Metallosphaera hakonensis TaxID=79601 RepID=UPI001442E734|nr:cation transporter [Metallosphaera hakonensis]
MSGLSLAPLSVVELYYGREFSSYILLEDGYHGLTDATVAILLSLVLRVLNRRSRKFPWGLYNAESLVLMFTSILIAYYSLQALIGSVNSEPEVPKWTSIITSVGALISLGTYLTERKYNWLQLARSDIAHSKLDVTLSRLSKIEILL